MATTYFKSPLGWIQATAGGLGVQSVRLVDESVVVPELKDTQHKILKQAVKELQAYFLDWSGAPEFHRKVWEKLVDIPYGRTTTYSAIAEELGDKKAVRAVGQANRNNPIAIIVPCHRVVAKSGKLQGYFYGLD
ncbi:unnamed protein product, partial [Cyprideis torosa]